MTKKNPYEQDIDSHWHFQSHTKDNLEKLTPNTKTGTSSNWKIVFLLKCGKCFKGVLKNMSSINDEYALISSINTSEVDMYPHRCMNSLNVDYKICQSKMIVPARFWNELKNRILY
jgi:hypothetical protein